MKQLFISGVFGMLLASTAAADGQWITGGIVVAEQSPYVGASDEAELLPYLAYETDRLHIGLDGINYQVIDTDQLSLGVSLDPRFAPDMPDTDLFKGLDRKDALEAGFDVTYSLGAAYATVAVQTDITKAHKGTEAQAMLGYGTEMGRFGLSIEGGLLYRDGNLNNYLFGVDPSEATVTRAAFDAGSSTNFAASITATYALTDNVLVLGELSYEDLGDLDKSPLVARSNTTDIILGVGYQF